MRLYLVRHGVSTANLDRAVNARLPDNRVPLAPEGRAQALEAGRAIADDIEVRIGRSSYPIRLLVSPYERTRQTAAGIRMAFDGARLSHDYREETALREMSFGLFDGIPDDELAEHFPREQAHYQKHVDFEGEFYARMPMGESRVQVADRVKAMFGTIHRDAAKGIRDFVIVSHGITIRAFIMQWMHLTPDWYEAQKNPGNCAVIRIEQRPPGVSPRYERHTLFAGFEAEPTKQAEREARGV